MALRRLDWCVNGTPLIDLPMLAPAITPATMPRFPFTMKPAMARCGATLTDVVWNLHAILTNPAAKPDEAKAAKDRMLEVLETTKRAPLPQMIVPSITLPPEREEAKNAVEELPHDTVVCTTRERPIAPAVVQNQTTFTKKSRASSSQSFLSQNTDTRRGTASAHAARANFSHTPP